MGWRKKELKRCRGGTTGEGEQGDRLLKEVGSKEGEITKGQNIQENHLRIVALWRLDEDLYFFERTVIS